MTSGVLSLALLTGLTATGVAAGEAARAGTEVPRDLRGLAEIDGDPGTFTPEEKRKMAVLQQVLGTDPLAPPPEASRVAERS